VTWKGQLSPGQLEKSVQGPGSPAQTATNLSRKLAFEESLPTKTLQCEDCGKLFLKNTDLYEHKRCVHVIKKCFECGKLKIISNQSYSLETHVSSAWRKAFPMSNL
jgi:hypothetical protein